MTQDEIIEMAMEAEFVSRDKSSEEESELFVCIDKDIVRFYNLAAAKAAEEAHARANASWTLMCNKMVDIEREAIIQIIKETPFSNWFQADVIEAIRRRGEQA